MKVSYVLAFIKLSIKVSTLKLKILLFLHLEPIEIVVLFYVFKKFV